MLKKSTDRFILGVFAIMFLAAIVLRVIQFVRGNEKVVLEIAGQKITAEVVRTPEKRAKGLSGRESLEDGEGMLFVFDTPSKLTFWMKGMNFPLDFIWIRGNEIRDLSPNVPVDYPGLLHTREEVDKVLEVNVGFVDEYSIHIGDSIVIDNN